MIKSKNSFGIIGVGSALPKKKMTNDDFVAMGLDTSDEWIFSRTGIKTRYVAQEETTASLAVDAAKKAIKNANIKTDEIDLIIMATSTPDYNCFPNTACLVQKELGINGAAAFDISAACSGFVYAIDVVKNMMISKHYRKALVIASDVLTKYCNWKDRSTVVLFGDAAGAAVIGPVDEGFGILNSRIHAKGSDFDKLIVSVGGGKEQLNIMNIDSEDRFIKMNGQAIFKFAVNTIIDLMQETLAEINLTSKDINWLIPHQANKRIIEYAQNKLGLSEDRVYVNIATYGNTSAASIPLAIDEAYQAKKIKKGDIIVTVGFGAGLTYGANVIKWSI